MDGCLPLILIVDGLLVIDTSSWAAQNPATCLFIYFKSLLVTGCSKLHPLVKEMLHRGILLSRFLKSEIITKCRHVGHTLFRKHLFLTNVGISMGLSGVGDLFQQHYEIVQGDKQKWDSIRTLHMSISGLTVGVLCHHWYIFLDKRIPGRSIKAVAKKVIADQILCSPICISLIFVTLGILERANVKTVVEEVVQKGWRLYVAEWIIWPPAQVINFYLLPTRFRVLYDNTISLGYDIYTSYVKHEIPLEESKP